MLDFVHFFFLFNNLKLILSFQKINSYKMMDEIKNLNYEKYSNIPPLTKKFENESKDFMEKNIIKLQFPSKAPKDWKTLAESLAFLKSEGELEDLHNCQNIKEMIKDSINKETIFAVILWTSNIIYRRLNHDLEFSETRIRWMYF